MTDVDATSPRPPASTSPHPLVSFLCLTAGVLLTLAVRGYRFGESNHAVYLVEAIRRLDPSLLARDWWASSTLQYHFVFNATTASLMRAGLLEPAFLAGYLLLAVLLHVGWRRLTHALGGSDGTYLVSVVLFYVLAGGVGMGMYHFLQDSAFLPSNVSNVAMLWGVFFWVVARPAAAGACLGVAGLFHINHALAGIGLWAGVTLLGGRSSFRSAWWVGTVILLALCAVQVVPAVKVVLSRSGKLPTAEFVDLFVRLRHPHHFDPSAWHWGIWLTFLAPLPMVYIAWVSAPPEQVETRRRARVLFALFMAMIGLALLTAGFWFWGETFVQLNLYRFSIYPKLLSCVAAAWLLWDRAPRARPFVVAGVLLLAGVAGAVAASTRLLAGPTLRNPLGLKLAGLQGDDAGYLELTAWARENTAKDAVFLVPPSEESFRVHARRAIVANFKGVPQLSAELPEWRDRLQGVLALDTAGLLALPQPLGRTLTAIRQRYDELPPEHHAAVAREYDARYVVLGRAVDAPGFRLVRSDSTGTWFLYDLSPQPQTAPSP